MDNTIDLPRPPNCATDQHNSIAVGENVIVSLRDGKNLLGKIIVFNVDGRFLAVLLKGRDRPVKIPLDRVQIVHFPSPKQWVDNISSGVPVHTNTTTPFRVEFRDASEMKGETFGYNVDSAGIYLYPKHGTNNNFQFSYTPLESVKTCLIGETNIEIPPYSTPATSITVAPAANPNNAVKIATPTVTAPSISDILLAATVDNSDSLESALTRQKSMPHMKLGEILVGEHLITGDQLNETLEEQKTRKGVPLGELLIQKGIITTVELQQSLAKKLGIPFVNLTKYQIAPSVLKYVPEEIATKHSVIPVHYYEDKLVIAVENPMNWEALDALRFNTNMYIEPVMATGEDIRKSINFYYATNTGADESISEIANETAMLETFDTDEDTANETDINDNVVVKLLNKIISDAQAQNVSDIHVEPSPGKERTKVRFRKDGSLTDYHELPNQYRSALVSRIKILAKLDISEKRRPQDGKIELRKPNGEKLELRVAIIPTVNNQEDVVMRILASGKPLAMEKLALSDRNIEKLKDAVAKPYGLFLVCGPTGSGKTTTLHSILGYINTPERKIWTAEDPVEITQRGLRQVQVHPKIGLDFAAAMRAFLRADPDVIMVGEMRDQETVHTGIEASLTGHLVFSTLHTNSAPESVVRLLDMGMDPFNFADALLGILAQRLAKRLCAKCKQAYQPDADELTTLIREYCSELTKSSNSPQERDAILEQVRSEWLDRFGQGTGTLTLYRALGCGECDNKGYRGRIGLHELLIGTDAVKRDILEKAPVSKLVQTALKEGMRTLRQDGIEKVMLGHTDIIQIRAVCSK